MEKITESLEMLYGSSGTPFFLSDEFGNIKWKNTACGETIVFPKGINCDILTEQINIDGKEYSAQGTSLLTEMSVLSCGVSIHLPMC